VRKKPDRKWLAVLVLATGMAWAAGSPAEKVSGPFFGEMTWQLPLQ
jgi:hypothetical protein